MVPHLWVWWTETQAMTTEFMSDFAVIDATAANGRMNRGARMDLRRLIVERRLGGFFFRLATEHFEIPLFCFIISKTNSVKPYKNSN